LATQILWDNRERQNFRVMMDVRDPSKRISRSITNANFIRHRRLVVGE
jgi:hypothetical protein